MTVSSTTRSIAYTGDASTVDFPVTYKFLGTGSTAELEVIERVISTGAETTKTYSTHYTVTGGSGSTGTVSAVSAPAATVEWHIRRVTTATQGTDYTANDAFPADTHEAALDRLTMIIQEKADDLTGAAILPATYTGAASPNLPEPTASAVLSWNAAATAIVNGPTTTEITDAEAEATAAAASAAAASTSETNAATSETNAATSETNASASAAAAAASAGSNMFNALSSVATADSPVTVVADTDDGTMFICTMDGNLTMVLPSIATAGEGERYGFLRSGASNTLTLQRNGSDTINGVAGDYTVAATDGELVILVADDATPDNWITIVWTQAVADEVSLTKSGSTISVLADGPLKSQHCIAIACSDETTDLATGTAVATFRMPYAFTITDVRASVTTAPTGSVLTVDINEGGATILSTKLTIDATEKTSTTAATPAVVSDAALADDAEITIDIDGIGLTVAGAGLKVYLIGYAT